MDNGLGDFTFSWRMSQISKHFFFFFFLIACWIIYVVFKVEASCANWNALLSIDILLGMWASTPVSTSVLWFLLLLISYQMLKESKINQEYSYWHLTDILTRLTINDRSIYCDLRLKEYIFIPVSVSTVTFKDFDSSSYTFLWSLEK